MEHFEEDLEKKLKKEQEKAAFFAEALPYIKKFRGKRVVIKIGGAILDSPKFKKQVIEDIVMLYFVGLFPIIVHGGGVQINEVLEKQGKKPVFHQGKRVTDDETMEVVQMVLVGLINQDLVTRIGQAGAEAIGISGQSSRLILGSRLKDDSGVDWGRVGQIDKLNVSFLERVHASKIIPVIAPIGVDSEGQALNINADEVAMKVAADLGAEKLIFVSDVDGVFATFDESKKLIKKIDCDEIKELKEKGGVTGGMVVKLDSIKKAIDEGVGSVQIISGKREHSLLLEIFTDEGVGTQIYSAGKAGKDKV